LPYCENNVRTKYRRVEMKAIRLAAGIGLALASVTIFGGLIYTGHRSDKKRLKKQQKLVRDNCGDKSLEVAKQKVLEYKRRFEGRCKKIKGELKVTFIRNRCPYTVKGEKNLIMWIPKLACFINNSNVWKNLEPVNERSY
jgi:hypothetical protein